MLYCGCVNKSIVYYKQKEGIYSTAITNLPRGNLGVEYFSFKQKGQIVTSEREIKKNSKKAVK